MAAASLGVHVVPLKCATLHHAPRAAYAIQQIGEVSLKYRPCVMVLEHVDKLGKGAEGEAGRGPNMA